MGAAAGQWRHGCEGGLPEADLHERQPGLPEARRTGDAVRQPAGEARRGVPANGAGSAATGTGSAAAAAAVCPGGAAALRVGFFQFFFLILDEFFSEPFFCLDVKKFQSFFCF
jgi:hypothetical protein